jgi:hypothetical protein
LGLYDTVIFTPVFDDVTTVGNNAIHSYVIPYIKSPWVTTLLEKDTATRKNLEDALAKVNPSIVWLDSHGSETCCYASEAECAADLDNAHLFTGRIVYILACLCGRKLAPAMVEKGARAVLAFTDIVILAYDAKTMMPTRPFLETLYYPRRLYDYISVGQVYDETIQKYNEWLDCLKVWDPLLRDLLLHDRDCFKLFGDPSAVVPSPSQLVASAEHTIATATVATLLVRFLLFATLRAMLGRK